MTDYYTLEDKDLATMRDVTLLTRLLSPWFLSIFSLSISISWWALSSSIWVFSWAIWYLPAAPCRNNNNIHCVHKKTLKFVFLAISQLLLGQIQKVRSDLVSLTSNISTSTWPNIKNKDSFEILITSRFTFWIQPSRSWDIWVFG